MFQTDLEDLAVNEGLGGQGSFLYHLLASPTGNETPPGMASDTFSSHLTTGLMQRQMCDESAEINISHLYQGIAEHWHLNDRASHMNKFPWC